MNIYIHGNNEKQQVPIIAKELVALLEKHGIKPALSSTLAEKLCGKGGRDLREAVESTDVIFCLGGDGTILHIAQEQAPHEVPILGINLGTVGFLAGLEPEYLEEGIERFLHGEYITERRLVLSTETRGKDIYAINDIVMHKQLNETLVRYTVYADGEVISRFRADGVVIASPTGSTAYSLSAGGPIAMYNADIMLVTPICPQTISARPIVVNGNARVTVEADSPCMVNIDGKIDNETKILSVKKAQFTANLIRLQERDYSSLIYSKLG